jgi:DNA-directed RNA polymerase subunit K/omega
MAIKTLDLDEIEKKSANIYEACLVIARRARQINGDRIAKRKEKEILDESGFDQDLDVYDREFFEGIVHEKEINPTVVAQDELFENKLKYRYLSEEDVKNEKMPSE